MNPSSRSRLVSQSDILSPIYHANGPLVLRIPSGASTVPPRTLVSASRSAHAAAADSGPVDVVAAAPGGCWSALT
eukprot:8183856-Pyramimonas_sp.AAC.1